MNAKTALWLFGFAVVCLLANVLMVIGAAHATQFGMIMVRNNLIDPYGIQSCLKIGAGGFSLGGSVVLLISMFRDSR